jgi:hypothetical protein
VGRSPEARSGDSRNRDSAKDLPFLYCGHGKIKSKASVDEAFQQVYVFTLLLSGCASQQQPLTPAIGEAYAGPSHLPIRKEIDIKSPVIATANHGDRLEILQRRRRFVRVRTPKRAEGWTEDRMLLSPEELAGLRSLSDQSKPAPSQGVATTYETLNVHTEPDRQSPSLPSGEGGREDRCDRPSRNTSCLYTADYSTTAARGQSAPEEIEAGQEGICCPSATYAHRAKNRHPIGCNFPVQRLRLRPRPPSSRRRSRSRWMTGVWCGTPPGRADGAYAPAVHVHSG